jgi:trehalose/maltose hydrolase-like predicted phosphorylase
MELAVGRSVAAVVFDWDGTAVADRADDAAAVRDRIERLCDLGVHVAVVSGTHVGNVDGQLRARPTGPGELLLALNRGSELFRVTADGPVLVRRVEETPAVTGRLDAAADRLVALLRTQGLEVDLVGDRLNRRKIDLIPVPEWRSPPKTRLAELVDAVTARLVPHGIEDLAEVVRIGEGIAHHCDLPDARVTSDGKYVEIGVTDKGDSMRALLERFADRGVGPGLVLVAGDEFGPVGGVPGSDSRMLVTGAEAMTVVSVGREPGGVPAGVRHVGGGPAAFLALLDEQLRRAACLRVPGIDADPRWTVPEPPGPAGRADAEALFTLAVGGVATRGTVEEQPADADGLVLAAGVYAGDEPGDGLLAGPDWAQVEVTPTPQADARVLDLRTGVLFREERGTGVPLRSVRFASLTEPGVVVVRMEAGAGRFGGESASGSGDAGWAVATGAAGGGIGALTEETRAGDGEVEMLERVAALVAEPRGRPRQGEAAALLRRAREHGFERLLAAHRAAWAQRWNAVDVRIPADPESEQAFRFALFQLWSVTGPGPELAVGARGLSGPAYAGHVFWDADVFVLPALMTIDPASAAAMVRYRLNRLRPARAWARAHGRRGARFPWESARTGEDVTPRHGFLGGHEVEILTGEREEHITADVAWAMVRHATWTRHSGILTVEEQLLLRDTARYWESRARVGDDGRAHVDDVIGPDEYHEDVDDNAFTNGMARWNLREAAQRCGGLARPGEQERWRTLADALVDGYDARTGVHEQFAGYFDLEDLRICDLAAPPVAADILAGRERIAASQVIKQPDVLMLHHLVPDLMPPGSLAADLDYYMPRISHGSSLSPGSTALVLARAHRLEAALELVRLSLEVDLADRGGTTVGGVHLGAAGSAWQALVFGLLGADVRAGVLALDPVLPPAWPEVEVRFRCLGRDLRVRVDDAGTTVSASSALWVRLAGGPLTHVDGDHQPRRIERRT